ncbi:unnamed protein product [Bemisia tabaci]|uniref:DNA polymerase epsilon subunit n=1 Tax=Bemisia tabaci TaxID=7038 RepID=A0A9P0AM94_BEMTA|nr:PREDICTED: DNA polymerase epsilon subunit 2 [Bemisia tabaci]CAH0394578.1 unnamed protein product [Bemisia tabaci]
MSDSSRAKKQIISAFQLEGFSLKGEACDYLANQLSAVGYEDRNEWIEKLIECLQKQNIESLILNKEQVETAFVESFKVGEESKEIELNVISVFDIPHFYFDIDEKKFFQKPASKFKPLLCGSAASKANLFRERYFILKQLVERNELFAPSLPGTNEGTRTKLKTVDYFLSTTKKIDDCVILGLLTQLKERRFYLEDPTGHLEVDLSQVTYHRGFITEGSYVLVEGCYEDLKFHATGVALPPPEPSFESRVLFNNVNTFGGPLEKDIHNCARLLKIEKENEHSMIIFLSDVWLDKPEVLEKLQMVLGGYNDFPPVAIVLIGNFVSKATKYLCAKTLRAKFKELGELIVKFPNLTAKTKFIIVPGPGDSPHANILPRPPLPNYVTEELTKLVKNCVSTSNPARIQYCAQEIVITRENLFSKIARASMNIPPKDVHNHFVLTILSQAHLSPVPLYNSPIYWDWDAALRIYPLPDVLVLADSIDSFSLKQSGVTVFNPGSFSASNYEFKAYIPASRTVEECGVGDDQ